MSSQDNNLYPAAPPPYDRVVQEDAGASPPYPTDNKGGPYPPSPQPAYEPQTQNPIPPPMSQGAANPVTAQPMPAGPTVVIPLPVYGKLPVNVTCPNCHQAVVSDVKRKAGLLAWLLCAGLFIVGCWPCCLIPFCVEDCRDTEHFCPNCKSLLGVYKRV